MTHWNGTEYVSAADCPYCPPVGMPRHFDYCVKVQWGEACDCAERWDLE